MNVSGYIQLDCNNTKKGKIIPFFEKVNDKSSDSQFAKDYYDIDENGYYSFDLKDEQFLGEDGSYHDEDYIHILAIIDSDENECKKDSQVAKYMTCNYFKIEEYDSKNNFIIYEKRKPILNIYNKDFENIILQKKPYHFDLVTRIDEIEIQDSCFNNNENMLYKYKGNKFFDFYILKRVEIFIDNNSIYKKEFDIEDEILSFHDDIEFHIDSLGNKEIKIISETYINTITEIIYNVEVKENLEPYLELNFNKIPYKDEEVIIKSNNIEDYYNKDTKILNIELYIDDNPIISFNDKNFEYKYKVTERKSYKITQIVTYQNNNKIDKAIYTKYLNVKNTKPFIDINKNEFSIPSKKIHFNIFAIDPDNIGISEFKVFIYKDDKIIYETTNKEFDIIFNEEGEYLLKVIAKDDIEYNEKEYKFSIVFENNLVKLVNMEEIILDIEDETIYTDIEDKDEYTLYTDINGNDTLITDFKL